MKWPWRRRRLSCVEVAHVLHRYLDGEIDAGRADLVARHRQDCRPCGMTADTYHSIKESLRRSTSPIPEPALERLRAFSEQLAAGLSPPAAMNRTEPDRRHCSHDGHCPPFWRPPFWSRLPARGSR